MRRWLPELSLVICLFLFPLLLFWPQTLGGRTLLPTENLYQYEPYATYREVVRAPEVPHNHLLSDMVLQNMQWKAFIRDSIAAGEVPLWNPHQFSGIPFMAAGQQSMLYPLSVLYYVLPLPAAYGWFTVLNLWPAGGLMYLYMRGLNTTRGSAMIAAVTYQLCGFFIASTVFPMITGAAAWLPLILLAIDRLIAGQRPVLWLAAGAGALACNIFAGHAEMTIYTLLIAGYYAAARLLWAFRTLRRAGTHSASKLLIASVWLLGMVLLGLGLGGIQLIPLYEFAQTNWRAERADLNTVLSYAHPPRDLIQFLLPNFYGNPSHHTYFDWFRLETIPVTINAFGQPITHTEWGIKNYVESALYVGILPLVFAGYEMAHTLGTLLRRKPAAPHALHQTIFSGLTLVSLTFMFGLPTYALIYGLPGINQLNSPFRWVYGVTVGIAVLAGLGAERVFHPTMQPGWTRRFGAIVLTAGLAALAALLLSRAFYPQVEPLMQWILDNMVTATGETAASRFADARMLYSYLFTQGLVLGGMLTGTGAIFMLALRPAKRRGVPDVLWQACAVLLIAADLLIASWGFNPASDPALLDFTPPSIAWLRERQAEDGPFRYITLDDPSRHAPLLQPNMTLRYGLDDVRGYESIIPADYVAYMRATAPQPQLDFNRIAPLYVDQIRAVDWMRLHFLNVRYLITHASVDLNDYLPRLTNPRDSTWVGSRQPVYTDEAVRIWQIGNGSAAYVGNWAGDERTLDRFADSGFYTAIYADTGREKLIDISVPNQNTYWLVVSESYAPGWRAYLRPRAGQPETEQPLVVERVMENFIGVRLPEGGAEYTVRLVYSPTSFQTGLLVSVISGALLVFVVGIRLWQQVFPTRTHTSSGVERVARNSVAPILLNLFNRGIDFAFAFVMLRVLGPAEAGIYQYAVVVFVWFDIFTNFGLNTYLTREVARDRSRAGYFLLNTSLLRLLLMIVSIPLLVGFIVGRQALVAPALSQDALITLGLLYAGLLPSSLSTGLTALYYAFEQAETPAAVATLTTINKAIFGLVALLLGYGIIGLAAVSIVLNFVTLGVLLIGAHGFLRRTATEAASPQTGARSTASLRLISGMARQSWPLMLNHFLATIFFQIDIVILEASKGAAIVGKYGLAYKWLLAINVIPAFFTQALLPVMSRQAGQDNAALRRTVQLGIKLLVCIAFPLAVGFTFTAYPLTLILGGTDYLPEGAVALQLMIWSIPIGWMNSLTQYVLIALNLQQRITGAFAVAVTFNIVTNLLLIPRFSYPAAALTTIASEAVLFCIFALILQKKIGRLSWLELLWRPALAAGLMAGVIGVLWIVQPVMALLIGSAVYGLALAWLRPLTQEETRLIAPLLPSRIRRLMLIGR